MLILQLTNTERVQGKAGRPMFGMGRSPRVPRRVGRSVSGLGVDEPPIAEPPARAHPPNVVDKMPRIPGTIQSRARIKLPQSPTSSAPLRAGSFLLATQTDSAFGVPLLSARRTRVRHVSWRSVLAGTAGSGFP